MIRQYFPECRTIGCFARITDVAGKTDGELKKLQQAGYDGLTIAMFAGIRDIRNKEVLKLTNKGYTSEDMAAVSAMQETARRFSIC